jgi:molecular chaperone DnaK
VPKIETTYAIDANGILTVTSRELESGNEVTITVEGSCRLSDSEVERMREELATLG